MGEFYSRIRGYKTIYRLMKISSNIRVINGLLSIRLANCMPFPTLMNLEAYSNIYSNLLE